MSPVPPLTVRPVVFTTTPAAWHALFDALGARPLVADGDWSVLALGSGRVAVHAVGRGDQVRSELAFESPDLATTAAALADAGATLVTDQDGPSVRLTGPDGLALRIDPLSPGEGGLAAAAGTEATTVAPLWVTARVPQAAASLRALGLRDRIASDSGVWVDLAAPAGGVAAVHEGPALPRAEVAFEHPDLDRLAARCAAAGLTADLVDESYGRSLRLARPDADEAGRPGDQVWVNETQTDLYGYHAAP